MSLIAHYTLNNTLANTGLNDDISLENMGSVPINAVGKTGYAAQFSASAAQCLHRPSFPNLTKEVSFSFWYKCTGATSNGYQFIVSQGRDYSIYGFNVILNGAGTNLSCLYGGAKSVTTSVSLNTWYHVVATLDPVNGCRLYVNGVLKSSSTYVEPDYTYDSSRFVIGKMSYVYTNTSTYFPFNGYICNVKVYDHALSTKEVLMDSQGLIMHYPMNNSGFGGENLLVNSDFMLSATSSVAASSRSLNVDYGSVDRVKGKQITLSFYYSSRGARLEDSTNSWGGGNRFGMHLSMTYVNTSGTSTTIYPCANYLAMSDAGRAVQTYTMPSDIASISSFGLSVQTYAKPASTNSETWWIGRPKLELGDKATPWCPNKNDTLYSQLGLNDLVEYDTSGFKNNGSFISGNEPFKSGNSPRYSGSYHFQNKYMYLADIAYENMTYGTISFWINTHSLVSWDHIIFIANSFNWTGTGNDFVLMARSNSTGASTINIATCSYISTYTPTLNKWLHVAITWDRTTYQIKLYFDGKLSKTIDDSTNKRLDTYTKSHNVHAIGNYSKSDSYKGDFSISDFRVYATALSASDISDLYNNVGSIDNNGNFYAHEFIEEDIKWT